MTGFTTIAGTLGKLLSFANKIASMMEANQHREDGRNDERSSVMSEEAKNDERIRKTRNDIDSRADADRVFDAFKNNREK